MKMATSITEIELPNKRLLEILDVAKDWSLCNGVSILAQDEGDPKKAISAPLSLFPSLVPAKLLQQAKTTMHHFNLLMHRVALDHSFLENALKNVIQADDFMKHLWDIYMKVQEAGVKQPMHLGLFRNDFMMNCLHPIPVGEIVTADYLELKQIEFNAISSSFAGLTERISELHRLTLRMAGKKFESHQLPENKPATGFAEGLAKAWTCYGNNEAVILYVVSGNERNVVDQRWLEFKLYDNHPHIRVLRRTFLDVHSNGVLDSNGVLRIEGDEVAVIYLRDGYTAENYSSEKEWNGRLKLEMSTAIKCPSIQYQLMGSKKIQQELARPGAVERFISDPSIAQELRRTFADLYSLDLGPEGDEAVEKALAAPDKFVLKPQREGGGHNLYSENITKFFVQNRDSKQREGYILMQRIFPWQQRNFLVKSGVQFQLSDVVSELGIYGVYLGSAEKEIANYECGHMMRTKITGTDEGGIVAGFAVLDTPFVI